LARAPCGLHERGLAVDAPRRATDLPATVLALLLGHALRLKRERAILALAVSSATPVTQQAEHLLRAPGLFNWSTVTLLALVVYVYAVEVERANWSAVLAGLAFWLMDWFNEIVNSLVLHFSGTAPLWAVTGTSSFVILIGLTV